MAIASPLSLEPQDIGAAHALGSDLASYGLIDDAHAMTSQSESQKYDVPRETRLPGETGEDPNADIKDKLCTYLRNRTWRAKTLWTDTHRRWVRYEQMRRGVWRLDDPQDVLSQLIYNPLISRRIDVMLATCMPEMFPDRTNYTFFDARSKIEHLDDYAEHSKAALRNCLMECHPDDAPTYVDCVRMRADNFATFGNTFSMWTLDSFVTTGGQFSCGVKPKWLDPFNVFPFDNDVTDISMTDVSIARPLDERQLSDSGYAPETIEKIRLDIGTRPMLRRDDDSAVFDETDLMGNHALVSQRRMYDGYIHFGRWPGREMDEKMTEQESLEMQAALGDEFDFTPEEALAAKWWHFEWVGTVLCVAQPYPIPLPENDCPIIHCKMRSVPGYLMGQGAYDMAESHERMYNKYMRAALRYGMLMTNPPYWYNTSVINQAFLQKTGGRMPPLAGGVGIPADIGPGGGDPLKAIMFNAEGIPQIMEMMQFHSDAINEITGVTNAVEGEDQSRTATQNANNLQQSMKTMFDYIGVLESGLLLKDIKHAYCGMKLSYELGEPGPDGQPYSQLVGADPSNQAYRTLMITADKLISLALLEWTITGSTAPGNKQNQIQAFQAWTQQWTAIPGILNLPAVARYGGEMMSISKIDSLVNTVTPDMLMSKLQNIASQFGEAGVMMYQTMSQDPQIAMAMGLVQAQQSGMAPMMPGQTGPGGPSAGGVNNAPVGGRGPGQGTQSGAPPAQDRTATAQAPRQPMQMLGQR